MDQGRHEDNDQSWPYQLMITEQYKTGGGGLYDMNDEETQSSVSDWTTDVAAVAHILQLTPFLV